MDEELEKIEEKLKQEKSKRPMPKSGRSVFELQKIIKDRAEPKKDNESPNNE